MKQLTLEELRAPLSVSPEKILEGLEETRPRVWAKRIYFNYPEHERLQRVDQLVPCAYRDTVRHYLTDWAAREKVIDEYRRARGR